MQQAFDRANEQLYQILLGKQAYNLTMVISELNDKLVTEIGGWVENDFPILHRYPKNPELLYKQVNLTARLELIGLLNTIQFNFDGEWYCLESAVSPNDDLWGIRLGDLVEYLTYRVKYSRNWKHCEKCKVDPEDCEIHRTGLRSFTPGKELKELMTHVDWCNTVMTVLRNKTQVPSQ